MLQNLERFLKENPRSVDFIRDMDRAARIEFCEDFQRNQGAHDAWFMERLRSCVGDTGMDWEGDGSEAWDCQRTPCLPENDHDVNMDAIGNYEDLDGEPWSESEGWMGHASEAAAMEFAAESGLTWDEGWGHHQRGSSCTSYDHGGRPPALHSWERKERA